MCVFILQNHAGSQRHFASGDASTGAKTAACSSSIGQLAESDADDGVMLSRRKIEILPLA